MANKAEAGGSSTFEKVMKASNLFSIGLLGLAIVTASTTLAMASAIDMTGNVIVSSEYKKWKKKKGKK